VTISTQQDAAHGALITVPAAIAACPERTAIYARLVIKSLADFTEQDFADWHTATGRLITARVTVATFDGYPWERWS
jgi:uncharacterized iron-regulated protein